MYYTLCTKKKYKRDHPFCCRFFLFRCFFLLVFFWVTKIASAFLFSAALFFVLLLKRSPLIIQSIPAPYVRSRLGTVSLPLSNSCEMPNCPRDRGILCVLMQFDYRAWWDFRAFNPREMRFSTFLRYRFLEKSIPSKLQIIPIRIWAKQDAELTSVTERA